MCAVRASACSSAHISRRSAPRCTFHVYGKQRMRRVEGNECHCQKLDLSIALRKIANAFLGIYSFFVSLATSYKQLCFSSSFTQPIRASRSYEALWLRTLLEVNDTHVRTNILSSPFPLCISPHLPTGHSPTPGILPVNLRLLSLLTGQLNLLWRGHRGPQSAVTIITNSRNV